MSEGRHPTAQLSAREKKRKVEKVFLDFPASDDYGNTTVREIDPTREVRVFQTWRESGPTDEYKIDLTINRNILRDYLKSKTVKELKRFAPFTNPDDPVDLTFIADRILVDGFKKATGWKRPPQALYNREGLESIDGVPVEGPVYCEYWIARRMTEELIETINKDLPLETSKADREIFWFDYLWRNQERLAEEAADLNRKWEDQPNLDEEFFHHILGKYMYPAVALVLKENLHRIAEKFYEKATEYYEDHCLPHDLFHHPHTFPHSE